MRKYRNDTHEPLTVMTDPSQTVEPGWTVDVDDDVHVTGLTLIEDTGNAAAAAGDRAAVPADVQTTGQPGQGDAAGLPVDVAPVVTIEPATDQADASAPAASEQDPEGMK